ncbi:MAG: hypothetical protein NTU44_08800 [Bacteroidetes bacterium]|nr:hypothetical protein [Bacteroidota bacterium]
MKKVFFLLFFIVLTGLTGKSQIVIFHEDFETPSLDDSVTSTMVAVPNVKDWGVNTRLHHLPNSLKSDSCQVKASNSAYLTTQAFSTLGNTYVILSFSQICKVDFLDIATLEASADGGLTWSQLTMTNYMGTGQYGPNGNRFAANSYGNLWQPSTSTALPMNTWWRIESFDVSILLGNCANAKIRFKLQDGGPIGPNNNKGWYIDNLKITMAPSELIPPVITLLPGYPQGTLYSMGPFTIKAKITDQSGIDTAYIVYSLNNGPDDTIGMSKFPQDTMKGILPAVTDSDYVCWYIRAIDNSQAHNPARNPAATCISFTAYGGITFPFYDNFDVNTTLWTPSFGGTNTASKWEIGTPAYGTTNTAHSSPNSWDVNLTTVYADNAYCILTSPVFDFSSAVNARLSFWLNYDLEGSSYMYDGTRLEYTTDGTNYTTLGGINDPLGVNWYNGTISSSAQPGWGYQSGGWKQSKFKLSALNNALGQVRFRFVFTSDGSGTISGVSMDDWLITLPAPQEAAIDKIYLPVAAGCGLGMETVKIRILNNGLTPITSGLTASYKKSPTSAVVTENVPGTIAAGDSLIFTFATLVDLSTVGVDVLYNFKTWVSLPNDPNHGDDTLTKTIQSLFIPNAPGVTSSSITYGTSTIITANSLYPITWFDALTGGNVISNTASYTTPILYGMQVYFPMCTAPNGCISVRAKDTVYVSSPPPFDGASLSMPAPVSGFNL